MTKSQPLPGAESEKEIKTELEKRAWSIEVAWKRMVRVKKKNHFYCFFLRCFTLFGSGGGGLNWR